MSRNIKSVNVEELKFNKIYQRIFEPSRFREIVKSIKNDHFWEHSILVVNKKMEIVDGQHRWMAAKEVGIKKLLVSIVEFENQQKEAEFFWTINNYKSTHLKPKDYWYARYQSGDIIANTIYAMNENDISLLKGKIQLKGSDSHSNLNLSNTLFLLMYSSTGQLMSWGRDRDHRISKNINEIGIKEVLVRSNKILNFVYECFGPLAKQNMRPYSYGNFRAIISLYSTLNKNEVSEKRDTIRKMQSYIFTNEFDRYSQALKTQSLINHFNSGKTKTIVSYNIQDSPSLIKPKHQRYL